MASHTYYKEQRDILRGIEEAEKSLVKQLQKSCDWHNPEDVAEYKQEKRGIKRTNVLDRLVPDRKCSRCYYVKTGRKEWKDVSS